MRGRWEAKNNPRDYGIAEILGRDYRIEEPYWGPSVVKTIWCKGTYN